MTSRPDFDVVVAGGGPVGWASALAARLALGNTARIAVVERTQAAPQIDPNSPIAPRVYTLAQKVLQWLEDSGVALDRNRTASVRSIIVHGMDRIESLRTSIRDARVAELAIVIEHDALTASIAARAQQLDVQLIAGDCIALHQDDAGHRLMELADQQLLSCKLLIIADGARSRLRKLADIEAEWHPYDHHGVVAHFTTQHPHCGAAKQWFLPNGGILALLPLPDQGGTPACSMVWSAQPAEATQLTQLTDDDLLERVNSIVDASALVERVISRPQSFPLSLVKVADPVGDRLLVIGDAAHAMHPLAGQGVNLGLADARDLQQSLSRATQVSGDAGHPLLLSHYRRNRYAPTFAMQTATDSLYHLYNFAPGSLLPRSADFGMRLLNRLAPFRRRLATAALGN